MIEDRFAEARYTEERDTNLIMAGCDDFTYYSRAKKGVVIWTNGLQ